MGKINLHGKDINKPFNYKGKNVIKITYNGKTLTFMKKNTFTGHFTSYVKRSEFMAITTEVTAQQFNPSSAPENKLTGITLPNVLRIGDYAFAYSPLTHIEIPKVNHMGSLVFYSIVNEFTTIVIMTENFNSTVQKDKIFGKGNWSNVHFKWTDSNTGELVNSYDGYFSTNAKRDEFKAVRETITAQQFNPSDTPENHVTGISLPYTTSIGNYAFSYSPLTYIDVEKADTIGDMCFYSAVNVSTTRVIMKSKFNTPTEKDRIFKSGGWSHITFKWV